MRRHSLSSPSCSSQLSCHRSPGLTAHLPADELRRGSVDYVPLNCPLHISTKLRYHGWHERVLRGARDYSRAAVACSPRCTSSRHATIQKLQVVDPWCMRQPAYTSANSSEVHGTEKDPTEKPFAELEAARLDASVVPISSSTNDPTFRQRGGSKERTDGRAMPTEVERKNSMGAALLSRHQAYDSDTTGTRRRRRSQLRNDAAFWLLGLINNSPYVIMMAVAKEIAPGAVGVVFLADVAPTLIIKVTAPYWFHLVPYSVRVWVCTVLLGLSLVTVGYGGSTGVQLLGVCFSSVQAGLGEASFLALASFYDTPRALTAWSSGTGFAGIFGYAWVFTLKFVLGLSFRATLMTANLLGLCLLYAYFGLLSSPNSPSSSSGGGGGISDSAGDSGSLQTRGGIGDTGSVAYSPLRPSRQRRHFSQSNASLTSDLGSDGRSYSSEGSRDEGEDGWGVGGGGNGGGALDVESVVVESSRPRDMTVGDRLRFTLSLWRFTVPLMLVYFAEYTMQTGTWSAIGFPVSSAAARQRFYEYANWCYQGGVFVSRSSGMMVRLSPLMLWSLPGIQVVMLLFFYLVAVEKFWYGYGLLFLCFGVGLVGGLGYVNAFRLVAEAVPPELKELALASASVGDSLGVLLSDMFGTFVQACVYKRNGIPGAWATC